MIAVAPTAAELSHQLQGASADVLVLDYDLARGDGLSHCQRIKRRPRPPAVIVYSAYVSHPLVLAARAAGADGVVDKAEPVQRLLDAIRCAGAGGYAIRGAGVGEYAIPAVPRDAYEAVVSALDVEDLPVLAMLLDGVSHDAIAHALRRDVTEVSWRSQRIVGLLRPGRRASAIPAQDRASG